MMSITQDQENVKPEECDYDDCHDGVFEYGYCFQHFIEEQTALEDDHAATRETAWAGVGYV